MKKLTFYVMSTCMLLLCAPQLNAENEKGKVAVNATENVATATFDAEASAAIEADLARLEEIRAMDLSTLSRAEKRAMRSEVKNIKNNLETQGYFAADSGGIYLSVGAIIIVVLLLILLL